MEKLVTVDTLRQNLPKFITKIRKGDSFTVYKRSEPVFRIVPIDETWEEVIDFTKIQKNGVNIDELISRLS